MQLILTSPPKVMVILKEISFNCGSPDHLLGEWYNDPVSGSTSPPPLLMNKCRLALKDIHAVRDSAKLHQYTTL